ncbi:hypothetical protein [Nocardioides antri]|uniref:Uncharacterized protein n=1 Tax=Nocardioides antri TaxID=2607659 RepID=A0A5B1M9K0_9ACTN|nr:hypothetical protein [Nocardioides antri]KAA1429228.1 hypothetical protein F0U47_03285 [Nocardioides antri]
MRTTIASTAAALAAGLVVGLGGPAHADLYGIDDPSDTAHGSDILALQVLNGGENVHVTTIHDNLRRDPATGSGGIIYVDTDKDDKGPEYVFTAGYFEGTDYALSETEGFGPKKWGDRVEHGDYTMRVRYKADRVHVTISRAALGDPGEIRVAVRASGTRTDGTSDGLVDWVGERRSFTPWIAQG